MSRCSPTHRAILKYLVAALATDRWRRGQPPISLPGRPANGSATPQPPPLPPWRLPTRWEQPATARKPVGHGDRTLANDGCGPYTLIQLWEMNAAFVAAVERAIADGKERRPTPP